MKIKHPSLGLGISSLVLVLVTVSLVGFGALNWLVARNDQDLTQKNIQYETAYYGADAKMQRIIGEVDKTLKSGDSRNSLSQYGKIEADELLLTVDIDDDQQLVAVLNLNGQDYQIQTYKVVNTREWDATKELNVWKAQD